MLAVFGKFRNNSLKNYGLCSGHYLSTPALSLDAMLNITKVQLELILDGDMHLLFKKGIRGKVSYISKRFSKANNKYLKSYDPKTRIKTYYIIYMVMNYLNFFQKTDSNG